MSWKSYSVDRRPRVGDQVRLARGGGLFTGSIGMVTSYCEYALTEELERNERLRAEFADFKSFVGSKLYDKWMRLRAKERKL